GLKRRALREPHDQAEHATTVVEESPAPAGGKVRKARTRKPTTAKPAKAPLKPRGRKKAVKVAPRLFAQWIVFDNPMKAVAASEAKDRAGADAKLAEVLERKPNAYFLLLVKDPYDPPAEPVAAV